MQVKITISETLNVKREEKYRATGTSYKGRICESAMNLVNIFGEPNGEPNDKTQAQWIIDTPAGLATIYDYKSEEPLEENTDWHVGGKSEEVMHWIILTIKKAVQEASQ